MDISLLVEIFSRFNSARILVIGDLMIDEYLWGSVERISPEAPVQVVNVKREERTLGGAGTVIANLVSLKGGVEVAGIIGDDANAHWIVEQMQGLGSCQAIDPLGNHAGVASRAPEHLQETAGDAAVG